MWALENETPFAAERTWVRDRNGAEVWIVAVKGTFAIQPDGQTKLAEKQEEVSRVPVYCGEPGKSSLLYESDLIHTKLGTDVLLHGHAYAPDGKASPQVDVTLIVGGVTKSLRVFGDRTWEKSAVGLRPTPPLPFEKMPLAYERAFGGVDKKSDNPKQHGREPRNPIGIGFAMTGSHLVGEPAPNIESLAMPIRSWDDRPSPAGFGPLPRDWSPRLEFAGTYDDRWQKERRPLAPTDFDERFFQAAPADQCAEGFLRGGEPVELRNLTPGGLLRFNLPRVVLGFTTSIAGGRREHVGQLHTVILEPDQSRVIMVWHTQLECHHDVYTLKRTRAFEKQRLSPQPGSSATVA